MAVRRRIPLCRMLQAILSLSPLARPCGRSRLGRRTLARQRLAHRQNLRTRQGKHVKCAGASLSSHIVLAMGWCDRRLLEDRWIGRTVGFEDYKSETIEGSIGSPFERVRWAGESGTRATQQSSA